MRTINAEMLRYVIDHEHSARSAWATHRDSRLNTRMQRVVDGEIKMVASDQPDERETEARERYEEAKGWLRLAMRAALGPDDAPVARPDAPGRGEGT